MKTHTALSTLITTAALAICVGQAHAQSTAALATAVSPIPRGAPAPRIPPVKDFAAARALELERTKFHQGQIDKLQKCLEGTKTGAELTGCLTTYRTTMASNLAKLIEQGRLAAAYDLAHPEPAPSTPAPTKK